MKNAKILRRNLRFGELKNVTDLFSFDFIECCCRSYSCLCNRLYSKKSEAAEDAESENQDSEVEKISDDSTDSEGDSVFDKKLQFAINSKDTFFDDMTFRLVVAILSGLTGVLKLLSTVQNDVPVIGDLIPAVAGLAACFALLIEFYIQKSKVELKLPAFLTTVFIGGRKYLGIFCIIAGVLHFIFPRVLFL